MFCTKILDVFLGIYIIISLEFESVADREILGNKLGISKPEKIIFSVSGHPGNTKTQITRVVS